MEDNPQLISDGMQHENQNAESGHKSQPYTELLKMKPNELDQMAKIGENRAVAQNIADRVRILCWVMTCPQNHVKKAIHIKETWGKRCDILLFMSTKRDDRLPTVVLPIQEGRDKLWGKTKAAFQYIYHNYLYSADWFLKADDDTYVVIENLRYMLDEFNTNQPMYFGFRMKSVISKTSSYMSGGAGYVLSRSAVTTFITQAIHFPTLCNMDIYGEAEDLEISTCLNNFGVVAMDTRDKFKRGRFFPFPPDQHVDATVNKKFWYWQQLYYPISPNLDCCSEHAISFHYVDPSMMYALEYFVYHVRPFGITYEYRENFNAKTGYL